MAPSSRALPSSVLSLYDIFIERRTYEWGHSVLRIRTLLDHLRDAGAISADDAVRIHAFLGAGPVGK